MSDTSLHLDRRGFLAAGAAGLAVTALGAAPAHAATAVKPPRLTLHVLDVHRGRPAAGMRIDLSRLDGSGAHAVKTVQTQANGRTAEPVLVGDELVPGEYELLLHLGDYYAAQGVRQSEPPFLRQVPIRFTVFAREAFHIPVLVTPWSYSTYRGS